MNSLSSMATSAHQPAFQKVASLLLIVTGGSTLPPRPCPNATLVDNPRMIRKIAKECVFQLRSL